MGKIKPNNKFKAVFNPYTLELFVLYGTHRFFHQFEEHDEWCYVNFNGDENHPNYLHIHCDYDESLQLIVYPRIYDPNNVEGSNTLNEQLTHGWYSSNKGCPRCIKIVNGDEQFQEYVELFTNVNNE